MSIPWKPHAYQKHAVEFMISTATAGLFLDPGLGKSSITLAAFKILKAKGYIRRMLVIAPLRPAHSVWPGEAEKWDEFKDLKVCVLHGPRKEEDLRLLMCGGRNAADVYVINPEGLPWLLNDRKYNGNWPWEMLTVDECFPAGTQVSTAQGPRSIETIKPGDFVQTSDGLREVLECGTRQTDTLVRLHLTDGGRIECTPEHPIFTDVGWVPAKMTEGRSLFAYPDLSSMWREVSGTFGGDSPPRRAEMLFSILLSETDVGAHAGCAARGGGPEDGSARNRKALVEQGAPVARGASEEDLGVGEGAGSDVRRPWRERLGDDGVRIDGAEGFADRVAVELRGRVGQEAAWLSYLLQARLCASEQEDRAGGGRRKPPADGANQAGPEEGADSRAIRVARVEDLERAGTTVYNLRVAGCPHFFAEGVLVHNSTRFKHANTQRFKTIKPWLTKFARRYILTGSPAPNGLMDLFGQIFLLDLGTTLGRYITHFRSAYFDATGYGGYTWVPRSGAAEEIYKKLKPLVLRMSAADYLDLDPYIPNTVKVDLPEKALKIYKQMESMLITSVEEEVVTAANVAAATGKCRQIANGGVYSGEGQKRACLDIHEAKLDAVEEIVEELGGKPALVAYEFEHDLLRLRKRFGMDTPFIGGGVSPGRFREIEKDWNAGRIPLLLAQPQSVAHGLNLQGVGAAVIWHSLTWDLENYEQLIRRVWRQGQTERVVVHHIVARGTIDEVIMRTAAAGGKKDRTQQALLEALKSHLKGRRAA